MKPDLTIRITADTSEFDAAMDRVQRRINRLGVVPRFRESFEDAFDRVFDEHVVFAKVATSEDVESLRLKMRKLFGDELVRLGSLL